MVSHGRSLGGMIPAPSRAAVSQASIVIRPEHTPGASSSASVVAASVGIARRDSQSPYETRVKQGFIHSAHENRPAELTTVTPAEGQYGGNERLRIAAEAPGPDCRAPAGGTRDAFRRFAMVAGPDPVPFHSPGGSQRDPRPVGPPEPLTPRTALRAVAMFAGWLIGGTLFAAAVYAALVIITVLGQP